MPGECEVSRPCYFLRIVLIQRLSPGRFPALHRLLLLFTDAVGDPPGQVDQGLAGKKHGDCGHHSSRGERSRAHGINGILREIRALFLRTFPSALGEGLRAQPLLKLVRGRHVPGLVVIAPYSAADAKGLLKAAIRTDDPVVFLENELLYGQHFDVPQLDDYVLPIGKARIVRPGKDVTIVSYSIGVGVALEAAQELMTQGINAEVIDLRTLRPLDKATVLESLKRTNRMVVVEEGWPVCSISSEIIAIAMTEGFDDLDAPVLRVTDVDVPLPYAANLEKMALIKASQVVEAVKAVTYR